MARPSQGRKIVNGGDDSDDKHLLNYMPLIIAPFSLRRAKLPFTELRVVCLGLVLGLFF